MSSCSRRFGRPQSPKCPDTSGFRWGSDGAAAEPSYDLAVLGKGLLVRGFFLGARGFFLGKQRWRTFYAAAPGATHARFCNQCGAALERRCGGCGEVMPARAQFCSACGRAADVGAHGQSHSGSTRVAERRPLTVLLWPQIDPGLP